MKSKQTSYNLKKYETKNPIKRFLLERFLKKTINEILTLKPTRLLDVGCGEAMVLERLSNKLKLKKVDGIDTSKSAIKKAKKNFPSGNFSLGDATKLKYRSKTFDTTLMFEVLEHLDDPEAAIREVKRVGSKYCLFSVPHEPYFTLLSLLSGMYLSRFGRHPEHVNFWNKNSFSQLLSKHFRKVEDKSSFPWLLYVCRK